MPSASLSKRFLETTRGQVVALLRRGARTVEELAQSLGLTDNAIRAHLASLERGGLVRQEGLRRGAGAGKPASLYEIAPDAEPLFSRAYAPVLAALLDELAAQLPAKRRTAVMEALGRRLATDLGRAPPGSLKARVEAGAKLLTALGGGAEVERRNDRFVIRGCAGYPLSAATAHHADLCHAVESLLTEFIGAPVTECCDRGERPRCRFEVATAA